MAETLLWSRRSFLRLAVSGTAAAIALHKLPPIFTQDNVDRAMRAQLVDILADVAGNHPGELAIGRINGGYDVLRIPMGAGSMFRWVSTPDQGIVIHDGLENRSTFDIRIRALTFDTASGPYNWTPSTGMVPMDMWAPALQLEPLISQV